MPMQSSNNFNILKIYQRFLSKEQRLCKQVYSNGALLKLDFNIGSTDDFCSSTISLKGFLTLSFKACIHESIETRYSNKSNATNYFALESISSAN